MLINIVGAESTGKTVLASDLSDTFKAKLVSEFARTYCDTIERLPTLSDIYFIADQQLKEYAQFQNYNGIVVFDTTLITSLIWMYDKFGVTRLDYHKEFIEQKFDLTILCYPDIGWQPDPLRQDANRQMEIHHLYVKYLSSNGKNYILARGHGQKRSNDAKKIIQSLI